MKPLFLKTLSIWFLLSAAPCFSNPSADFLSIAHRQINQELRPFPCISKKMVNTSMQFYKSFYPNSIYRFKIIEGKVYTNAPSVNEWEAKGYVNGILHVIKQVLKRYSVPDTEFIYFTGVVNKIPTPPEGDLSSYAPIFSGFREQNQKGILLWCDRITEDPHSPLRYSRSKAFSEIDKWNLPWQKRYPRLFWRGRPTDYHQGTSLRFHLVKLSLRYPQLADARLTGGWGHFKVPAATTAFVSLKDHLSFKYQIVMDGINCSNSGFHWRLYSDSVVLKVDSPSTQWFEAFLIPYVHYLPVRRDLSDLIPRIRWLQTHDFQAHALATQAKQFAKNHLTEEAVLRYCYLALKSYSERLNFTPQIEPGDRKG